MYLEESSSLDFSFTDNSTNEDNEKECGRCYNTAKYCGCIGFPTVDDVLKAYQRMESREEIPDTLGTVAIHCCKSEDGLYQFKKRVLNEEGKPDWDFLNEMEQKIGNKRLMEQLLSAKKIDF